MSALPPKADIGAAQINVCQGPEADIQLRSACRWSRLIPDLCAGQAFRTQDSAIRAASIWIGRVPIYPHLSAIAPAQIDMSGLLAAHKNRGVQGNLNPGEHIGVGAGAHDRAAERLQVRAASELDRACGFPLGGLGLRSHANRGAKHRCNRN